MPEIAAVPETDAELVRRTLEAVNAGIGLIESIDATSAELVMVYIALMEVRGPLAAHKQIDEAIDIAWQQGHREGREERYEQVRAAVLAELAAEARRPPLRLVAGALANPR